MKMMQLAVRGIRASLGRLVLTTIAIVAGVGFVAGSFILADSLKDTFSALIENDDSGVDAKIAVTEFDFGDDVRAVPDSVIADVEALPEVGEVGALVLVLDEQKPVVMLDSAGNSIEPGFGGAIFTSSWNGKQPEDRSTGSDPLNSSFVVEAGIPPVGSDQVALSSGYAGAAGVEVGDRVTFTTPVGERAFELATIIDEPEYAVLFDFGTAQTVYGKEGEVDFVTLGRAQGVSTEEMITTVEGVLPAEATVSSQEEVLEEQSVQLEQMVLIFRSVLLGFAGVALFVSLFIIYNTFAILVTQRLHQIGLLRAVGATKGQIRTGVIFEALLVGLVGSLLGLAFGFGIAFLIQTLVEQLDLFPDTNTVLAPRTIVVALVVGMGATVVSALLPSFLAGRVSPVAAMRNEAPSRTSTRRRIASGAVLTCVGVVLLGFGLFGGGQSTATLLTELAGGVMLTFVGVTQLSVLFAGPFVSFIGKAPVIGASLLGAGVALPTLVFTTGDGVGGPIGVVKILVSLIAVVTGGSILVSWLRGGRRFGVGSSAAGLAGRLARQNAARAPQRTAATATALTIGIALISTVGVVGQSLKASFGDSVDRLAQADLYVFAGDGGTFPAEVADGIEELDSVATLSRFRSNEIRIGTDVEDVTAYQAVTGSDLIDFEVSAGSTEGLLDGGVLVFADEAEERSLSVGDTVALEFVDLETEQLVVAGIFENNTMEAPWIIDLSLYEQHVVSDEDVTIALSYVKGAEPEAARVEVSLITDGFSSLDVQDSGEVVKEFQGVIDILIAIINYMLAFALFIAFLGVVNTIVLSVIERTREVGLLRAVGMTRRQVKGAIRWEAVMVCLFGATLGIALGVVFATAAVAAIPDDIIATVALPYESVLFTILVAVLAGMAAAVLPARRAAKMDVLDAIATGG